MVCLGYPWHDWRMIFADWFNVLSPFQCGNQTFPEGPWSWKAFWNQSYQDAPLEHSSVIMWYSYPNCITDLTRRTEYLRVRVDNLQEGAASQPAGVRVRLQALSEGANKKELWWTAWTLAWMQRLWSYLAFGCIDLLGITSVLFLHLYL